MSEGGATYRLARDRPGTGIHERCEPSLAVQILGAASVFPLRVRNSRCPLGDNGGMAKREAYGRDTDLTRRVIGAAIEVHRCLGPGLLERAYESAPSYELGLRGLQHVRQVPLPIRYKGILLHEEYRIDLLIEDRIVVELKCVEKLLPIHSAQVMTYLRLGSFPTGLLLNFKATMLKHGIRRFAH